MLPPTTHSSAQRRYPLNTTPLPQETVFTRKVEAADKKATVMLPDVDELVISANTIATNTIDVAQEGSFKAVINHIKADGAQLALRPYQWLGKQSVPTGQVEQSIGFVLSGVMLPFSLLAMKAGVDEMSEACRKHSRLTAAERRNLQSLQELDKTDSIDQDIVPVSVRHAKKIETHALAVTRSAIEHNLYTGGIGVGSFFSGAAIFIRTTLDTVIQVVTLTVMASPVLLSATTVIGMLGTFFFAPIGAFGALLLGGFFFHQARMVVKELAEDRQFIKSSSLNLKGECSKEEQRYQDFIDRKFESGFATRFMRWNAGFLAGATFFAASAFTKASLAITATTVGVSATVASGGIVAVTLLGIAGGIGMAACCWQFLVSYGKSKKHQAYRIQESPFLGRRFDNLQTEYALTLSKEQDAGASHVAAELRTSLYDFAYSRDWVRQKFLQERAAKLDKYRAWEQRATDDEVPKDLLESKEKQRYKNVRAAFSFVGTYLDNFLSNLVSNLYKDGLHNLRNLFSSAHKAALYEADKVHALQADNLTVFGLARWLDEVNDKSVEQQQRDVLASMLYAQQVFLEKKLKAYGKFSSLLGEAENMMKKAKKLEEKAEKLIEELEKPMEELELKAENWMEQAKNLKEAPIVQTFAPVMAEADKDRLRLDLIEGLLRNNSVEFKVELNCLKRQFLRLQGCDLAGLPDENATAELNTRLAEYLMTDERTETRGILFDMHRRSFQLQQESQAALHLSSNPNLTPELEPRTLTPNRTFS